MSEQEFGVAFRQLSGISTALEFAIRVLITTHPDRKQLARVWHLMLPGLIDRFMEHPGYAVAEQRDAINEMLAELAEWIDMELPGDESEGEDE